MRRDAQPGAGGRRGHPGEKTGLFGVGPWGPHLLGGEQKAGFQAARAGLALAWQETLASRLQGNPDPKEPAMASGTGGSRGHPPAQSGPPTVRAEPGEQGAEPAFTREAWGRWQSWGARGRRGRGMNCGGGGRRRAIPAGEEEALQGAGRPREALRGVQGPCEVRLRRQLWERGTGREAGPSNPFSA